MKKRAKVLENTISSTDEITTEKGITNETQVNIKSNLAKRNVIEDYFAIIPVHERLKQDTQIFDKKASSGSSVGNQVSKKKSLNQVNGSNERVTKKKINYEVQDLKDLEIKSVSTSSRIVDYSPHLESDNEEGYEVDFIYGRKNKNSKDHYLIRWKGYKKSYDTWEPRENILCDHALQAFRDTIKAFIPKNVSPSSDDGYSLAKKKYKRNKLVLPSNIEKFFELVSNDNGPPLSIVNNVDNSGPPEGFTYINECIYSKEIPSFSSEGRVRCTCVGDCGLRNDCECVKFNEMPPYDKNGRLLLPLSNPIYECSDLCGCSSSCRYKVVQRGRTKRIQIFKTEKKGWGVRALEIIPPNTFIAEYVGEIITDHEAEKRGKIYDAKGNTYLFDLDFYEGPEEDVSYVVDAYKYGNVSHFFNHSCNPNLAIAIVYADPHGEHKIYRLAFFSTKTIHRMDELCFDYDPPNISDNPSVEKKSMENYPCYCGAPNCRGYLHQV